MTNLCFILSTLVNLPDVLPFSLNFLFLRSFIMISCWWLKVIIYTSQTTSKRENFSAIVDPVKLAIHPS
jgi:hypothetical protein